MKSLGDLGEDQAIRFLEAKGLQFVARQFKTPYGEIDCIVRDGDTYVFVEVKTRSEATDYLAVNSVTASKKRRVMNAAMTYVKKYGLHGYQFRFDLVLIEGNSIEWIEDAFDVPPRFTL